MPSIVVSKADLEALVGLSLTNQEVEDHLQLVKGELKRGDCDDQIKIELNDTNRPDTWSVEGVARQIRQRLGIANPVYDFFAAYDSSLDESDHDGALANQGVAQQGAKSVSHCVGRHVDGSDFSISAERAALDVRPVIGAFACKNIRITDYVLEQIIQTQEKLCENFGSKRRAVAIGVYNLDSIVFPVIYRGFSPDGLKFEPLQCDRELTLAEILEVHPKGQQYASLLRGHKQYPVLMDSAGQVLSMPPVINSKSVGGVTTESTNLFVEATGDDLAKVTLALNILAYNLQDRGGEIVPVTVNYEERVAGRRKHVFPRRVDNSISASHDYFVQILGEDVVAADVETHLKRYGVEVEMLGSVYTGKTGEYRADYLHPVDLVEDYIISRGYQSIVPENPGCYTIGKLTQITNLADKARRVFVGFGFEELFSNMLTSREEVVFKSAIDMGLVEIDNVMTENYGVVRNSILPSLLRAESTSGKAMYPHRLFEVGEVAVPVEGANYGSATLHYASILLAHSKACFSELHSYLENFFYYMGVDFGLEHRECPWLISGRGVTLVAEGRAVGWFGEVSPEVLLNWDIRMPTVAAEIDLTEILALMGETLDKRL